MGRLQGKAAIVTGAGGGIGGAITRLFASEGASVIGVDLDPAAMQAITSTLEGARGRVAMICADVAEESTAKAAVTRTLADYGRLDVLVTTAVYDLPLAPVTAL